MTDDGEDELARLRARLAEAERTIAELRREGDPDVTATAPMALARLAAIVESSSDAIVGASRDGVIEHWSPGAERLYGYPAEEALARPLAQLEPPDRAGETTQLIAQAMAGELITELETVRRRRDGSDVEVALAVSPIRDAAGRVIGCASIARDISERKRAERRFRAVLESAPDALVAVDGEGRMVFVNGRMAEVFGYRQGELLGQSVHDVVPEALREPPEAHHLWEGDLLARRMMAREVRARRKDGTVFDAEVTLSPVGDPSSGAMVIASIRDVTERNALREQLLLSDRMATIGTLAAGVAHEINNPLAAVSANLDLAKQELEEVARGRGSVAELASELDDARDAANRVQQIVRDLKIFSRADTEQRYAVDVRQAMESALRMAFNEIRHRARLEKDYGFVPRVYASESRLGQVFLNVLVNAAQAIPEGNADHHEIRVTTALGEPGFVLVSISDTGHGMTREVRDRLFTPFYTTRAVGVGTGLGLSICHRLVTGFGGTIAVESEVGRGTVVRIALPIVEEAEVTRELPAVAPAAPRRGQVLVVDDEVVIGVAVRRALSREHDVTPLSSATEALERLRAGERFDVILCDLMMPQMTGMELYAAVVELDPAQAERMVFLTGGAFTPAARAFLDQTSNIWIEKPFDVQRLRALVNDRVR